jgi:hypothetical protein
MRSLPRITTCLAALLLAGCEMPTFSVPICWDDFGCGSTWGTSGPTAYIIGFPTAKLDSTAMATGGGVRGLLHVGDTITLYVVSSVNFPSDTLRTVDWSADIGTAQISVRSDGGMTLVATALGQVIVSAGNSGAVWSACDTVAGVFTCTTMGEIDVVP